MEIVFLTATFNVGGWNPFLIWQCVLCALNKSCYAYIVANIWSLWYHTLYVALHELLIKIPCIYCGQHQILVVPPTACCFTYLENKRKRATINQCCTFCGPTSDPWGTPNIKGKYYLHDCSFIGATVSQCYTFCWSISCPWGTPRINCDVFFLTVFLQSTDDAWESIGNNTHT